MIIDPWGTIVASAAEREAIIKAEIYPETVASIREEFTPLKDSTPNSTRMIEMSCNTLELSLTTTLTIPYILNQNNSQRRLYREKSRRGNETR